jgi:transcriptional regulator with XRE-family HTH domain
MQFSSFRIQAVFLLEYNMLLAYTEREKICFQHIHLYSYAISIGKQEGTTTMANTTDLQEIMGRVIRRERQDRHLTIKDLGDKAGLSEIYVGEIERGQKYPSAKVLESLANALDLDIADLLELMAEEIRYERHQREPHITNAIGFTLPATPGQPRRLVIKKMVNMLDEGDVESVADFSAFLLSKHHTPQ